MSAWRHVESRTVECLTALGIVDCELTVRIEELGYPHNTWRVRFTWPRLSRGEFHDLDTGGAMYNSLAAARDRAERTIDAMANHHWRERYDWRRGEWVRA